MGEGLKEKPPPPPLRVSRACMMHMINVSGEAVGPEEWDGGELKRAQTKLIFWVKTPLIHLQAQLTQVQDLEQGNSLESYFHPAECCGRAGIFRTWPLGYLARSLIAAKSDFGLGRRRRRGPS